MSSLATNGLKHILVTTDFSQLAASALRYVIDWLEQIKIDRPRVTLVHAAQNAGDVPDPVRPERSDAYVELQQIIEEYSRGTPVRPVILDGSNGIAAAIAEYAAANQADMIVMTSHGRTGISHLLLGSVAESLVTCAPCPVFVLPGSELNNTSPVPARILVTTDFSTTSWHAFPAARALYLSYGISNAQLTMLHVAEDLARTTFGQTLGGDAELIRCDAESQATTSLMELVSKHFPGLPVMSTVIRAVHPASQEISEYIKGHNVDIIVIASQGKSGLQRFVLGSMSRHLLQQSHKKILVVPNISVPR